MGLEPTPLPLGINGSMLTITPLRLLPQNVDAAAPLHHCGVALTSVAGKALQYSYSCGCLVAVLQIKGEAPTGETIGASYMTPWPHPSLREFNFIPNRI